MRRTADVAVVTHELGHVFAADDEYDTSRCGCSSLHGVFRAGNPNCFSCGGRLPCLMNQDPGYYDPITNTFLAEVGSRAAWGWQDDDADGVIRALDPNRTYMATIPNVRAGDLVRIYDGISLEVLRSLPVSTNNLALCQGCSDGYIIWDGYSEYVTGPGYQLANVMGFYLAAVWREGTLVGVTNTYLLH
jgi:hypothetical protein